MNLYRFLEWRRRDRYAIVHALFVMWLFVLTFLSCSGSGIVQFSREARPFLAAIDSIFAPWNRTDSPGCVIAIAKDGKPIFARGYGMANLEYSIPMKTGTVSESGSVAKQFVAAAVVLLAQRGALSLDDPIRKYLPEVPDFGEPITIRQLISHTSGLRDIHGLFGLLGQPSYNSPHVNDEVLAVVARQQRLNFAPGTEFSYTNTGYVLLTLIVQRVGAKPFDAFCQENIFQPLGMKNTQWRSDFTRVVRDRATAYSRDSTGAFKIDMPYSDLYGNGGLLTTVGDLLIWNESFESGGPEWREVTKLLQIPSKLNDGRSIAYALGLFVGNYRGTREVAHGGSTAGYRTYLARYPEHRLSIALLSNAAHANATELVRRVADLFLGDRSTDESLPRVDVPMKVLEPRAGLYKNQVTEALVRISTKDGKLAVGFGQPIELVPVSQSKFRFARTTIEYSFEDEQDGRARRLVITPGDTANRLVFVAVPESKPTPSQLNEYTGAYRSEELGATHSIFVQNARLMIRMWPAAAMAAEPTYADAFLVRGMAYVRFTRDQNGRIDGFNATTTDIRCREVRFVLQR